MKFDLPDFLDSLKGLTRGDAVKIIQSKMEELYTPPPPAGKGSLVTRGYTREYNFLENLLYEVRTSRKSDVKKVDREEIDDVLKNLKFDSPIKIIKKTAK